MYSCYGSNTCRLRGKKKMGSGSHKPCKCISSLIRLGTMFFHSNLNEHFEMNEKSQSCSQSLHQCPLDGHIFKDHKAPPWYNFESFTLRLWIKTFNFYFPNHLGSLSCRALHLFKAQPGNTTEKLFDPYFFFNTEMPSLLLPGTGKDFFIDMAVWFFFL